MEWWIPLLILAVVLAYIYGLGYLIEWWCNRTKRKRNNGTANRGR
jgi:hypothetical protein